MELCYALLHRDGISFEVHLSMALLLAAVLIYISLTIPRKVVVSNTHIVVKRPVMPVTIELSRVILCRRLLKSDMERVIRLWGSGGMGGIWGWFNHPRIGKFRMFTGDMKNLYEFVLDNGKRFVISIDPADSKATEIIARLMTQDEK